MRKVKFSQIIKAGIKLISPFKKCRRGYTVNIKYGLTGFVLSLILISPVPAQSEPAEPKTKATTTTNATVINFLEYQPDSGKYEVKMTITRNFLRIDDTMDASGFILFDRHKKIIYSVSDDNKQIIQINNKAVTIPSPIDLKLSEKQLSLNKNAPLIEGKTSEHHQFFVNEKLCYEMISVPGLMPDEVTAMQNFKQVLAGQQAETLTVIPGDLQEGCDLSQHTFYPRRYLQKGFPIMEKAMLQEPALQEPALQEPKLQESSRDENSDEKNGSEKISLSYSRVLINYAHKPVSEKLFKLPDYEILPIN